MHAHVHKIQQNTFLFGCTTNDKNKNINENYIQICKILIMHAHVHKIQQNTFLSGCTTNNNINEKIYM